MLPSLHPVLLGLGLGFFVAAANSAAWLDVGVSVGALVEALVGADVLLPLCYPEPALVGALVGAGVPVHQIEGSPRDHQS